MINLSEYLNRSLAEALEKLDLPAAPGVIQIDPAKNPLHGDLATNLALIQARTSGQNTLALAEQIVTHLELDRKLISEISVAPPGFINFRVSREYYLQVLETILQAGSGYGRGKQGRGQRANVEFVSANPTGPLTVGHGRQAVLGDTIANILEWNGYQVTREYYYNDAGRQMRLLAQSVEARYFQQLNRDVPFPEEGYQGQYIADIANRIRRRHGDGLPAGDPCFGREAEEQIFFRIKTTLAALGIHHDLFSNEKSYYESGAVEEVVRELKEKDLAYDEAGATWFKTSALGRDQDRVLIKSSGEPTYRLPDIAYHRDKLDRGFDLIIDLFGADHRDTYPDVLVGVEALGYDTRRIRVLIHQFVTLLRGAQRVKMSTRRGEFVTLDELIAEVGRDVVRYFFIMRGMNSHLNFDLDLAADQSEKNPVYYLQYAHARICNIIKHGAGLGLSSYSGYDPARLQHDDEIALLKKLDQFPLVMENVLRSLEPQTVVSYLQELATRFHKFYTSCRVVSDDRDLSRARLALVSATRTVLYNGLSVLGISAPDRM